jgi:hypothetical protein
MTVNNATDCFICAHYLIEDESGLIQTFKDLIDDIYRISSMIPRIAKDESDSTDGYLSQMTADYVLEGLRNIIIDSLAATATLCQSYRENLEQYSYLWTVCLFI